MFNGMIVIGIVVEDNTRCRKHEVSQRFQQI